MALYLNADDSLVRLNPLCKQNMQRKQIANNKNLVRGRGEGFFILKIKNLFYKLLFNNIIKSISLKLIFSERLT